MSLYPDCLTGLGKVQGEPNYIELDPDVASKKTSCRPGPIHQQVAFKQQCAEMHAVGIFKPVDHATPWINRFVIVNKNSLVSMANHSYTYAQMHLTSIKQQQESLSPIGPWWHILQTITSQGFHNSRLQQRLLPHWAWWSQLIPSIYNTFQQLR